MDFQPFDEAYQFDPDIFIDDFPDYLIDKVKRWMRDALVHGEVITAGNNVSRPIIEQLELRLRVSLPANGGSLINFFTAVNSRTRNMLTMILQNYATAADADSLKQLLREASSAYTVEPMPRTDYSGPLGGYILVNRVPEVERMQAQPALNSSDLLREAYLSCYKLNPDYAKAVRKANDYIEGLLTRKFWSSRTTTVSVHNAVEMFRSNPAILHFKGDSFVEDKSKLIGLLEGIARIRDEHTTGSGRPPTPDEAEYVVQTSIYLHNLLEPIDPTNN